VIIGKEISGRIKDIAAKYPENILIKGFVDDISFEIGQASALLAPLLFGSGVKIKIIEAMAGGLPVIASPIALEGVVYDEVNSGILNSNIDEFINHIEKLTDRDNSLLMSRYVRAQYVKHYSRESVFKQYRELFIKETK